MCLIFLSKGTYFFNMNKWIKLAACIGICLAIGIIGSVFTMSSIPIWYESLKKPSFAPPNWAFGPVWTTLYILMGISLYLVLKKEVKNVKTQLIIFGVQLTLNVIWSFLFFGLQNPFYAFIEIILLWIAILFTSISFYRISKKASMLLIPYIVWVSFASILNYYVWILN